MNNRGLTIVELITTFALTTVIVVLLINVVIVIKNVYSKTNIKTELYINQSNLSNVMNKKINSDNLDSYEICEDEGYLLCYVFNFVDGDSIKLSVTQKQIKFGEYVYKLNEKTNIENPSINKVNMSISDTTKNNSFIIIKIPIICELYPNINFGINLVYPYNFNKIVL